jgi:hypothetical protein
MIPFVTQHTLGIILWGSAIGSIAVWFACELINAKVEDEVLPPPQPDERDRMAEWYRIMEETET